jgi:hypothetical protein
MADEQVPTGDGSQPNETPAETVDTNSEAFQAAVAAAAQEKIDFAERAREVYEEELAAVNAWKKEQEAKYAQPPAQPRGNEGDAMQAVRQFYAEREQEIAEAGADPAVAKAQARALMAGHGEIVKLIGQVKRELTQEYEQKLADARGEIHKYKDSRAFQDLAHEKPTIGGVAWESIPREVVVEAQKIRDREIDGLSPVQAIEMALGRKGGQKYVQTISDEKARSEAATGLPSAGAGFTSDKVRKALSGKDLSNMSLAEMEKAYQGALEE